MNIENDAMVKRLHILTHTQTHLNVFLIIGMS